jgi:hypothetical protein
LQLDWTEAGITGCAVGGWFALFAPLRIQIAARTRWPPPVEGLEASPHFRNITNWNDNTTQSQPNAIKTLTKIKL